MLRTGTSIKKSGGVGLVSCSNASPLSDMMHMSIIEKKTNTKPYNSFKIQHENLGNKGNVDTLNTHDHDHSLWALHEYVNKIGDVKIDESKIARHRQN